MPESGPDVKPSPVNTAEVKAASVKADEVKAAGAPGDGTESPDLKKDSNVYELPVDKLLMVHNAQEKITITLYQFRTLVSLGVLGFVYHEKEFSYNWMVKSALSFGFILFALGNGMGAVASQKITASASAALREAAKRYGYTSAVLRAHDAIPPWRMTVYQVVLTAIVLIAMWFPNISAWARGVGHD